MAKVSTEDIIKDVLSKWCSFIESTAKNINEPNNPNKILAEVKYYSGINFNFDVLLKLKDIVPFKNQITDNAQRGYYWLDYTVPYIVFKMIDRWICINRQIKEPKKDPNNRCHLESKSLQNKVIPSVIPVVRQDSSFRTYETNYYELFKGINIIEKMFDIDVNKELHNEQILNSALGKIYNSRYDGTILFHSCLREPRFMSKWQEFRPHIHQYNIWSYMNKRQEQEELLASDEDDLLGIDEVEEITSLNTIDIKPQHNKLSIQLNVCHIEIKPVPKLKSEKELLDELDYI